MDFDSTSTQPSAPATPTAVDTPSSATMSTPVAQPTTNAAPATPPAPGSSQAPATGAPGEGWVPSWRLREQRENVLREARGFLEQKQREYEAREAELNKKIQALAGFGPQPDPEVETIKSQFYQLFPWAKNLDENKVQALLQMAERTSDIDAQTQHYWTNYGQQNVSKLFSLAEADIGRPLTEEAKAHLHEQFVAFVKSSEQRTNAYASDPSFVESYWKALSSNFIDPVRRVSAASAQDRAGLPVPQDTPAAAPRMGLPEKHGNLDDRVARSWTAYQQSKR